MVCRALQRSAHNDEAHGEPDHAATPQYVTNEDSEDAAEERAKAVGGHNDAGDGVTRVIKLREPVFVLEEAAENPLIVAKEEEGGETAGVNRSAQRGSAAIMGAPGGHKDEIGSG